MQNFWIIIIKNSKSFNFYVFTDYNLHMLLLNICWLLVLICKVNVSIKVSNGQQFNIIIKQKINKTETSEQTKAERT